MRIKISIIIIIAIMTGFLSGCYDRREVDDLAYAVAIGLDKGKTNILRLTLQLAVPLVIAGGGGGNKGSTGGGGGGGAEGEQKTDTIVVETPSLLAGVNMINNFLSKQVNLSHAQVIVISEELAREGQLDRYLHAIVRSREIRPNMYVAVSRGTAESYIRSIKPILDANPSKYYNEIFSTNYTGFITNTQFFTFYNNTEALDIQPVATLVSENRFKSDNDFDRTGSTYAEKGRNQPFEGDYKAGDIPKSGDVKGEAMGMAVFKGDRMVGELDGENSTYWLMVIGRYNYSFFTFPDPKVGDRFVVINLKQSRNPIRKVDLSGGKPVISLTVILEGDIASIQSSENYESDTKTLETAVAEFLKNGVLRFLNQTKEFGSDICGFGREAKMKFLTWKEWIGYKWLDRYRDATFNVNVDFKIRRPGLIIRSIPATETSGGME